MTSEALLTPKSLPSDSHEVIVVLESIHVPWEPIDLSPRTYEALVYRNTLPGKDDVAARIKNASIVICTICQLTGETLSQAPYLKCILGHAVGTDHIDLAFCQQNGIQVMNSTGCNSETVAEHALGLYFATRRSLVTIHNTLTDFSPKGQGQGEGEGQRPNEWKAKGSMNARMRDGTGAPPRTCREEVAGIVGYGAVGQHIARLCTALGMKVVISSRKNDDDNNNNTNTITSSSSSSALGGSSGSSSTSNPKRIPFTTLLTTASVLFLAVPLSPSTRSLLAKPELALLAPSTIIINVSRGGIVDEEAMLAALKAGEVFGYGTDVFATEPAGDGEDSCLLGAAAAAGGEDGEGEGKRERVNLVMTGHLAWFSETTVANQVRKVGENLRAWMEGKGLEQDVIVRGSR